MSIKHLLTTYGLNDTNILDYFSHSPFYDKLCNNEVLKMQNQFRGYDIIKKASEVEGFYYEVEYRNNDSTLFIIKKAEFDGKNSKNIEFYYIIMGYIYIAPTNLDIEFSKNCDIFYFLNQYIDILVESMDYDPFKYGYLGEVTENAPENILDVFREIIIRFKKETADGS